MSRRRTVSTFTGLAGLSLAAVLSPVGLAHAVEGDPTVTLTITPTSGVPGAELAATVVLTNCAATSVTITGRYFNVDGDDNAATPPVEVAQTDGEFRTSLAVPADAARSDLSDAQVTFTASADCTAPTPQGSTAPPTLTNQQPGLKAAAAANVVTGTAKVTVLATAAPTIVVDPDRVKRGASFRYTVTGCTGGLVDLFFEDADGTDVDIDPASVIADSATAFHGTFTTTAATALGDAGLFVDCAQAAGFGAGVVVTDSATTGDGGGAPVAVPVRSAPHFTG